MNKQVPQNIEAEQSLIGACIVDNQVIPEMMAEISTTDFYRTAHQQIWTSIVKLTAEKKVVDVITLTSDLRDKGLYDEVGGAGYIMHLSDAVSTATAAPHYAALVKEKSILRKFLALGDMIQRDAYSDSPENSADIINRATKALMDIAGMSGKKSDCRHISEVVSQIHKQLSEKIVYGGEGEFVRCDGLYSDLFIPSGFPDFDRIAGGLVPSWLHVIAGRPGMGKSTLALCMALAQALEGLNVCIFSFEISRLLTVLRMIAKHCGMGVSNLMRGPLDEQQYLRFTEGIGAVSGLPIWVWSCRLSLLEIKLEIDKKVMELGRKPDVIYIDRLEFIAERQLPGERRDLYLGRITGELAGLAKDLEVPIILLVQLSRQCELRQDKRPILSDLRDSGAIEQDAKMIVMVYRDEYYNPTPDNKGLAEIIILKNSDGGKGTVHVSFRDFIPSFDNLARQEE